MQAIRVTELGDSDVLKLEQVPIQEPASDQILVKVEAIGVNPIDAYTRSGYQSYDSVVPYTPWL